MINDQAKKHLAKAKEYLAKGDEFYRKAKPEIDAAYAAGASLREMAGVLNKSAKWCKDVLDWNGRGTLYGNDSERRQRDMTKQYLTEASPKKLGEVIAALPDKTKEALVEEALGQMTTHGKGPRQAPTKPNKGLAEAAITFELIGVLGKLRGAAQEDPQAPLVAACMDLMRETLEILEGIREAGVGSGWRCS